MTPITAPSILRWTPEGQETVLWGYTGFVIFAESHFSYHTWPEAGGFMMIDITTCKDIEKPEALAEELKRMFDAERMVWQWLERGRP